jgi:hypothetical protein
MKTSNEHFKQECARIEKMNAPELKTYIECLRAEQNSAYVDDDLVGDIAISHYLTLATKRYLILTAELDPIC